MKLPNFLDEKLTRFYYELGKNNAAKLRQNLTSSYKNNSGQSVSLINSKSDSTIYAISRMPATYVVIHSLIETLIEQGLIDRNPQTIADFGSGTGSGFFACKQFFKDSQIFLFERDKNMKEIFNVLSNNECVVNDLSISDSNFDKILSKFPDFDLTLSSYVLSEMTEKDRAVALKNILSKTKKYFLLIDTGTPKVYEMMLKLKQTAEEVGFKVVAPCKCDKCTLNDDYCQFYARLERSFALRESKQAKESYEDEKYFYLLFEKKDSLGDKTADAISENDENFRIIRRPVFGEGKVELVICGKNGVTRKVITKKNKQLYKAIKKSKINDLIKIVWK